jgi:hypothetical protein
MKLKYRFDHWISSWLDIICGLISVLTFCYYRPWWDFGFRIWTSKKHLKKVIISKEKANNE